MGNVVNMAIRVTLENLAGKGLGALTDDLNGVGHSSNKAHENLTKMVKAVAGGVFLGSAAALGTFIGVIKWAVDQASAYEQTLLKLKIATNGTDEQMQKLKGVLEDVAGSSQYSVGTIGDAVVVLGQLGVPIDDLINTHIIRDMKNLAEATRTDPVQAAKLLGTTLEMFGISAKDSTKTVDLLQFAMEHGVPSALRLQTYLSSLGPTAKALGVPLDETVAIIDTLARAMGTGTDVGASMRYMLTTLSAPTGQQADALARLGIITVNQASPALEEFKQKLQGTSKANAALVAGTDNSVTGLTLLYSAAIKAGTAPANMTFMAWATSMGVVNDKMYDSKGHFKDMVGNIHLLQAAYAKLNPEQQAFVSKQLFNVRSGQAARVLMDNMANLDKMMKLLKISHDNMGKAAYLANIEEHTYAGTLARLQTNITSLGAEIGMAILPILTRFLDMINSFVQPMITWVGHNQKLVVQFLEVGVVVSGLMTVLSGLALVIMLGASPMVVMIAVAIATYVAIMALTAGIVWLMNNWKLVMASPIGPWLNALGKIWHDLSKIVSDEFTTAMKDLAPVWNDLMVQMVPIMPVLKLIGGIIVGIVVVAIVGLIGMIIGLVGYVGTFIRGLTMFFAGLFQFISSTFKLFAGVYDLLAALFTNNHKAMISATKEVTDGLKGIWEGSLKMIQGAVTMFFGAILTYIIGFGKSVISMFTHLADVLVGHSIIPDMLKLIQSWFTNILGGVLGNIGSFVGNAAGWFQKLPGMIMQSLSGLGGLMQSSGSNMIGMFGQGIQSAMGGVLGSVGSLASSISNLLGHHSPAKEGPLSDDDKWMPNMIRMFEVGVRGGIPTMKNATTDLAHSMAPNLQAQSARSGGVGAATQQTYNLILDKKTLASFTMNSITGQLTMNGAARMLL